MTHTHGPRGSTFGISKIFGKSKAFIGSGSGGGSHTYGDHETKKQSFSHLGNRGEAAKSQEKQRHKFRKVTVSEQSAVVIGDAKTAKSVLDDLDACWKTL